MLDEILDSEEDLVAQMTLILVHFLSAIFHLWLEHGIEVWERLGRRHRDVGRGQRLVLDLINSVPEKDELS